MLGRATSRSSRTVIHIKPVRFLASTRLIKTEASSSPPSQCRHTLPTLTSSSYGISHRSDPLNFDQRQQSQQVQATGSEGIKGRTEAFSLPQTCPGCGAFAQGVGVAKDAGIYSLSRRSVKAFVSHRSRRSNDSLDQAPGGPAQIASEEYEALKHTLCSLTDSAKEDTTEGQVSVPACNRCHHLLHHGEGHSIIHPSLQSLRQIISSSPYSYNHIYHVLDAADFPLSYIPQLQQRLELTPQRSQNRRAETRSFIHGRRAEMSFIITRSDLLAPQKEQVDSLMPYLLQVLRDALGPSGKYVRLGNVCCVSAKRGWWTKQVKDVIWERGGGGWMVGKVNVGKSNLFECIFPKGRRDGVADKNDGGPNQPSHRFLGSRLNLAEGGPLAPIPTASPAEVSLLPPPQLEMLFPIMPIVSHLPGTTASPIRIPFGNGKGELVDLPGIARGSLEEHVIETYRPSLVMRQRVKPEQFVIKPGQSLLISGLIRITPKTPGVVVLAYPFVPLSGHVTSTERAVAISTQTQPSGVPTIAKPGTGQKMERAGSFQLQWDVTKQRAGPLTARSAAALSTQVLPFVVFSTDILIEGCGWVELVAQVRKKNMESRDTGKGYPEVEVWSPNGDYIAARRPMNGWLMGKPKAASCRRARPRRSMKGVKKNLKASMRTRSK